MEAVSPLILIIVGSIVLSVFATGLGTAPGAALRFWRQPAAAARGMAAMFLVVPLVAMLLALLLPLAPAGRTALLALALSPLPPPLRRRADGWAADHDIGLRLTAALVSVIAAPALVWLIGRLFDHPVAFEPIRIVMVLLITVAGPLLLGMVVHRWWPAFARALHRPLAIAALTVLAAGVLLLIVAVAPGIRSAASPVGLLAITLMIVLGLGAGYLLGGPEPERRRAVAVAVIARHPGVAIALGAMAGTVAADALLGAILLYLALSALAGVAFVRLTTLR